MTARDPLDDPELDEQYEVDGPAVDEEDVPEAPELVFASVDEWFRRYWRFSYRRRVSGKGTGTGRWSARWWENDEALQRLTTLWRGWEAARQDPALGTSAWWINHADPHMILLLSSSGPFASSQDENLPGKPLPYTRPPEGLFDPDRQSIGIYNDTDY
jgi:hypothetical protein